MSQMAFSLGYTNYKKLDNKEKINQILKRSDKRKEFYDRLIKFVFVCLEKKIRMIFENPYSEQTYLKANFLKFPDVVDMDRSKRGDFRIKPTAYWFWNCENTNGFTHQQYEGEILIHQKMKQGKQAGLCSEERSMISSDYARNWICDFVYGGKRINNDGYNQGGSNVHKVIEYWLKSIGA